MAAPTATLTNGAGTITTSGEDNGFLIPSNPKVMNPVLSIGFSSTGSFTSVHVGIRSKITGLSKYYAIPTLKQTDNSVPSNSADITLTNSTNQAFQMSIDGYDETEVWVVSGTFSSGLDIEANITSGNLGAPITVAVNSAGAGSFTNITASGTLAVTGASTLTGDLTESGNAAITGTLAVTGASTLTGDLTETGNATVGGTLSVTGTSTLAAVHATSVTATGTVALTDNMTITDAKNIVLNTTTGTKIGTGTTQKLGFFNATPVVQPAGTDGVITSLTNLGLLASGAHPLTLNGLLTLTDVNMALGTSTGTIIGTATTQKLGFYGTTAVVQQQGNGTQATAAAGSSTAVFLNTTFTGSSGSTAYTCSDIVLCLKTLGLIKA